MQNDARPHHRLRTSLAVAALAVGPLLAACSSTDEPAAPPASTAPGATGTAPGTTIELSDQERLAEAKTVAVGFFEAQAVNDYDRAQERSDGAAALTIEWARAVNAIAAADESGYQVPAVTSPNVRVQIDQLTSDGPGVWNATGFVELSFRPGPVASTTTVAGGTETTVAASPSTYVVDLRFVGEGADIRLADYRLDDLPYPVSQLFVSIDTPEQEANGLTGRTVLGHRDLDGSVQYVVALDATDATDTAEWSSAFTPAPAGSTPGTALLPVGADSVDGTTFVDPIPADTSGFALVVFPGAFPGSAGTLTLAADGAPVPTTAAGSPPGSTLASSMSWALPDFPELTPRPVNTVDVTTSTTSSSTTTSSTTTTTEGPDQSSTTAPPTTSTTVTTTRPTTTTTAPSSITTSTTAG